MLNVKNMAYKNSVSSLSFQLLLHFMNYDRGGLFFEPFSFCCVTGEVFMIDERLFNLLYWLLGCGVGEWVGMRGSIYCAGRCFVRFFPGGRGGGRKWDCIAGLGGWL